MRISASLTSSLPGIDPRLAVRNAVARARAANDAGLDAIFVGDHHANKETYLQNTPFLGRLLAEWGDRPAGCLFLFPLWNPVLLAEQVGTLAAIASGRFIVQTGLGAGPEFPAMGADPRTRPSAFEEGVAIVRRLLAGETVSSDGRFRFEKARIAPTPQEPVEIWIGASADVGIDRAARIGDGWLGAPHLTPDHARDQAARYLDAAAREGRPPTAVALRRDVYIAADEMDAAAVRNHATASGYRRMPPSALVIATIDRAADELRSYAQMGYTDIVIRHLVDEQSQVLASYERLGEVRRRLGG